MSNNYLPTDYQTFIATSRYARWLEDEGRRENFRETVDRCVSYYEGSFEVIEDEKETY